MMVTDLIPGVSWLRVLIVVALVLTPFAAGWWAGSRTARLDLETLRRTHAEAKAGELAIQLTSERAGAKTLQQSASAMADAGRDLVAAATRLEQKTQTIQKDYRHATQANPLPRGCVPGLGRVRELNAAAEAGNAAAAR
ncbi:hypothetical protein ACTSKR_11250 [Chitinibacteraceae bacterium HSL-7]